LRIVTKLYGAACTKAGETALQAICDGFDSHLLHMEKFSFEEGIDYYLEKGKIVYTERYLKKRGTCCGNICRHCPFDPTNSKGNKNLKENINKNLD
jgi:hypothetical protein